MPANKNALLRYRIIDSCLTNTRRPYPTLENIRQKIEEQLDDSLSTSMLNKDLAEMKRIYNAPIQYCRTRKGYFYAEPEFSIKEFPLTHREIEALDFSTALLSQLKGTRLLEQYENAINKVIEGYRISKVLGKSEKHLLQTEEPVKTKGAGWIEEVLQAIIHKDVLCITYQPFDREEKVHRLSPYLLKEYRNRWYVIGHSDRIGKVLVMALDRIKAVEKSKATFITDPNFQPEEFFRYSFGITQVQDAAPQRVVLSFTPYQAPYILSQPLHHSQKLLLQSAEEVQVELTVYLTAELVMTVLGYGDQVRVLAPEELKNRIKNILFNMLQILQLKDEEKETSLSQIGAHQYG